VTPFAKVPVGRAATGPNARHLAVLRGFAAGGCGKTIAHALGMSEPGVRQAALRARRWLRARTLIEAVVIAKERGLI